MLRDLERIVNEAVALARGRGGALAAVTLAAPAASEAVRETARKLLARRGAVDVELDVIEEEGPGRVVAVEVRR